MSSLERDYLETLVSKGDTESCRELFEHFYSKTYAAVMSITRNHQTSEDIVQEAFIRAFNGLDRLREPAKFGSWVGAIATNLARDHLKKEKKLVWTDEIEQGHPSPGLSVEEQLLEKEEVERIREILRSLPPEQYQIMILYYYYETKVEDIASLMEVNPGTVKSRLHRARQKLHRLLQEGELNGGFDRPRSTEGKGEGK